MKNLDNFLKIKLESIAPLRSDSEEAVLYNNFYDYIPNETLSRVFAILHSKFNTLFSFMNDKNNDGRGGHYNAAESRELLSLIKDTRVIIKTLERESDEYRYKIDEYYRGIIDKCNSFLTSSGGSSIPENFPVIELIDYKPIFIPVSVINISQQNKVQRSQLKEVGSGSYAQVFRYKDSNYNSYFALKRAKKSLRPDELERFKIEFDTLKDLDSPYIIKAHKYNDDKSEYTMEYADQTLEQYLRYNNQELSFDKRRRLIGQLLKAFNYIHSKALLHRDISYRNILLKHYEDQSSIIKISDFGLVKITGSQLTRQGTEIKGALNDYSDLNRIGFENYSIEHETFALSKIIYFILTGRRSNYSNEKVKPLRDFILKATSSDKKERFQNVSELYKELSENVYPTMHESH